MNRITTDHFLRWAQSHGISEYRRRHLQLNKPFVDRYWSTSMITTKIPLFASHILDGIHPWSLCYLWPAGGIWSSVPDVSGKMNESRMLQELGLSAGSDGAIVFSKEERQELVRAMSAILQSAWSQDDDIYLVPDHARQLMFWSHHDLVHVSFAEGSPVAAFEIHMASQGHEKESDDYFTGSSKAPS
jgi:hypothetical protein